MHAVVGRGHAVREVVRSSECPLSEVPLGRTVYKRFLY